MSGLGIAVLSEVAVAQEIAQGRLAVLPWREADVAMVTLMAWHKDKWLAPALRAFLGVTRTILKPLASTGTGQAEATSGPSTTRPRTTDRLVP